MTRNLRAPESAQQGHENENDVTTSSRPRTGPGTKAAIAERKDDALDDGDIDSDSGTELEPPTRKNTLSKSYTPAEERGVLRKLDRRLTLFLCLLYLLSFLDRSNIGNARVAGLQTSLGITGSQFDLTLLAFYVTYIAFEWMILLYRLVPPHIYIAGCVFAWGLIACLQSVVTSFGQLLVLRAALGVTEAAFGPGVPYYMTFFYRREELAYRVGLQISAAPLATSFASSLAWVIVKLSENGPLESWRALFLFEGFPSLIAAIFAFYLIPDSPSQARWLTARERKVAALRLHGDSENKNDSTSPTLTNSDISTKPRKYSGTAIRDKLSKFDLLTTMLDPKSWTTALMFFSVNVSFASLPVFLPTIINSMSFSPLTSQLLAAPPYLVAFAFVLLTSRLSDSIQNSRGLALAACATLSCLSYTTIALAGTLHAHALLADTASVTLRYAAVYPAACGLFSSVVLIITWTLNNQASTTGRGMGMVLLNLVGQCGPLVGVRLFPAVQGPLFVPGMAVCAAFMGVVAVLAVVLRWYLVRLNRRGGFESHEGGKFAYEMVGLREDDDDDDDNDNGGERRLGDTSSAAAAAATSAEEHEGLVHGHMGGGGGGGGGRHSTQFRYML